MLRTHYVDYIIPWIYYYLIRVTAPLHEFIVFLSKKYKNILDNLLYKYEEDEINKKKHKINYSKNK